MKKEEKQSYRNPADSHNRLVDVNTDNVVHSTERPKYFAYPRAMKLLAQRLNATPEELAAWVFFGPGPGLGGLTAYLHANELDPPPKFHYIAGIGSFDYLSPLMACWFREEDISNFQPIERYILGKALIERWSKMLGMGPEPYIQAKIRESRLMDGHPFYGMTQASRPDYEFYPPLETGLFALSHIEEIEAEDFGDPKVKPIVAERAEVNLDGPIDQGFPRNPCAVFSSMEKLTIDEVSIAFVGDKSEFGIGANNILEITARGELRRVALAALDLVDRRRGSLNSQGIILLGMAQKKRLPHANKIAAQMTRLRRVFHKHLGISADPFNHYRQGVGWEPLFKIVDKRGAADERAKREAERKTDSYEQINESGEKFSDIHQAHHHFESENDLANDWLKKNDPDVSA